MGVGAFAYPTAPVLPGREPDAVLRVLVAAGSHADLELIDAALAASGPEVVTDRALGFQEASDRVRLKEHNIYVISSDLGSRPGLDLIDQMADRAAGPMILIDTERTDGGVEPSRSAASDYPYESSQMGMAIVALPEGVCVSVNAALCDFLGFDSEELTSMPFAQYTHPDDIDRDLELFNQLVGGDLDSYRMDKRYITSAGETVWGRLRATLLHVEGGERRYAFAEVIDIDETEDAEQRLAFQASLLDQIRTPIAVTDRAGRVTFWNSEAEAVYGWKSEEATGNGLLELVVPDIDPVTVGLIQRSLSREGVWEGELGITRKDGQVFPAWASGAVTKDGEGLPAGVVAVVVDLADIRNAEAEARVQAALTRSLLDSVEVPIAVFGPDRSLVASNLTWGDPPQSGPWCVPVDIAEQIDQDTIKPIVTGIDHVLQGDLKRFSLEYPVPGPADERWMRAVAMPPMEGGVIVAHWDITDERFARSAMEENLKAKDDFIAAISHELRSPLSVVVGLAELMREGAHTASDTDEFHTLIADQAQEMALIVEDLLVAGRLDTETLSIHTEDFDIASEVDLVLRPWQTKEGIDVISTIAPETVFVHADRLRFRQILRNLVGNAIRYGASPVAVGATVGDGLVNVEVIDHGDGVADEALERMFEPYTAFAHTEGQPSSLGLGLHVARRLARIMGGNLSYHRENDETIFDFALPAPT